MSDYTKYDFRLITDNLLDRLGLIRLGSEKAYFKGEITTKICSWSQKGQPYYSDKVIVIRINQIQNHNNNNEYYIL